MLNLLKYIIPAVIVLGILVFIVFNLFSNSRQQSTQNQTITATEVKEELTQSTPAPTYTPQKGLPKTEYDLTGTYSGKVTITGVLNQTLINIDLPGAKKEIYYPAFVYSGSCSNLGKTIQPLTRVIKNESSTAVDEVYSDFMAQKPMVIAVSELGENSITTVSCVDLK